MTVNKKDGNILARIIYVLAITVAALPFKELFGIEDFVTPAVALFAGLVFAMIFSMPFPKFNKKRLKNIFQGS